MQATTTARSSANIRTDLAPGHRGDIEPHYLLLPSVTVEAYGDSNCDHCRQTLYLESSRLELLLQALAKVAAISILLQVRSPACIL